jgi:hypothetical protein
MDFRKALEPYSSALTQNYSIGSCGRIWLLAHITQQEAGLLKRRGGSRGRHQP